MRKTTLTRWVPRPTFGGLVGGAAVLLFLTAGTAYAANEWNGSNIVDGSLTTADIANNNLTGTDIANGSISIFDLAPDAVNSARILDTSVANADLAGGAVTAQKMAPNSVNTSKIVNGTITTDDVADGSLTGTDVADDSITSADVQALDGDLDIIDNTITTFDIATDAIDSDEVLDFGLSNQDIGVLFAEVNGDATLASSSGSVTSTGIGTGDYEVDFGRDVTACTAIATIGPASTGSASGEVNVADRAGNPNAVFVDTNASDGSASALPFRLVVVC